MRRPRSLPQPRSTRLTLAGLAALAALATLAGCPGNLDDPGRFAAQFGTGGSGGGGTGGSTSTGGTGGGDGGTCPDIPTFFAATCTATGCHSATSPAAELDLASPDLATRLAGKMATGGPGLLLDPAMPASSILYEKLQSPPPFGSRMPLVGTPLSDAQMACVLSWITTSN
jgi:hypothetical protein